MNRRQFTTRLAALFAAPALPAGALAATGSASVAAPVVVSTGASSWASYLMAMHKTCTPTMLKSVLNVSEDMAQTLHSQMVSQGVIQDSSKVVRKIKSRDTARAKPMSKDQFQMQTRPANAQDIEALTDIWFDGWHEAHAAHVPETLADMRTRNSFAIRLADLLDDTSIIGPIGAPYGFCTIKSNEIYQIYLSADARGTGAADALLADGEARLAARGITRAVLNVIPENPRAITFYLRNGWAGDTTATVPLETLTEPFPLTCLILEKDLV